MSSDDADAFIALGPAQIGFQCNATDLFFGGYMTGKTLGLWAQGRNRGPVDFYSPQFHGAGVARCKTATGS